MSTTNDDFIPIFSHPDLFVLSKPPGIETISQDGGPELVRAARAALGEPGLAAVHRLDRDTSGAQILSRTREAEQELTGLFRHRRVEKTYLALCLGAPRNRTGVINRNLSEWGGGRRPVRVLKKGGLEAATRYRVLLKGGAGNDLPVGLLAFSPHQGRTHQIRVHAAALGYPILGDDQYGDRPANKLARSRLRIKRQMLHSWCISFPWKGESLAVRANPYQDFQEVMDMVFGTDVSLETSDD